MERTVIRGKKYDIVFGADLSEEITRLLRRENIFVVTDDNVARLYAPLIGDCKKHVFPAGEQSKTLETAGLIPDAMLTAGCNRKTTVIALGGGVAGDVGAFCASVFMRGVSVIQIPTTLMAMADSSIGGKCGVNSPLAKNIIGTFHQPSAIYTSLHFLKTLPEAEIAGGMGEVFKTALLDAKLYKKFAAFSENYKTVFTSKFNTVAQMCIRKKLDVATRDERETTGLRKILNVGHTVGHALEIAHGCRLPHGVYVLHGIILEAKIAAASGAAPAPHTDGVILTAKKLIGRFGFKDNILPEINGGARTVAHICTYDKKNDGGISIVASVAPGETREVVLREEELAKLLNMEHGIWNR